LRLPAADGPAVQHDDGAPGARQRDRRGEPVWSRADDDGIRRRLSRHAGGVAGPWQELRTCAATSVSRRSATPSRCGDTRVSARAPDGAVSIKRIERFPGTRAVGLAVSPEVLKLAIRLGVVPTAVHSSAGVPGRDSQRLPCTETRRSDDSARRDPGRSTRVCAPPRRSLGSPGRRQRDHRQRTRGDLACIWGVTRCEVTTSAAARISSPRRR